jgi:hypothetical protein
MGVWTEFIRLRIEAKGGGGLVNMAVNFRVV